ncbi:acylneuraminate cytidylyltransferase family protein [Patescibacteria group bacterium]|nr:acylneuraminate cytidylyltransferase family protein [Patescibacteria group bacterium]MBU2472540.1 acylneuraminate cytidylyltransferase family protein [Patescibacteria group bacterium]
MKKKVLAIIPARGGSKGIPNKNLKKIDGKPLIYYPIALAKSIKQIDRVIVSTEDKKIANIAKNLGAEIPFMRPKRLALNNTPTMPVLNYCLKRLEKLDNFIPDIIILLYATGPLISKKTLEMALSKFIRGNYLSLVPVVEDHGHYWKKAEIDYIKMFYPKERKNRQQTENLLKETGGFYLFSNKVVKKFSLYGQRVGYYIVPKIEDIDIDDLIDFNIAKLKLKLNKKIILSTEN